ncbi:serine hydrolase domain-containing protein [Hyphomonas jannaschiana]|uniref:serine hydrolase domain-containing protein n=1 Tax=Hyphomonas jannaschiana TaxID=86 RepID=UPI0035C69DD7
MLRNIFLICLACLAAPFAAAQALVPLPAQADGVAWPTAGWETGALPPEHADEIQELLDIAMVGNRGDLGGETHAVVIVHKGRLVAEVYRDGFGAGTRHMSWSLAKSVTSALVGRAVQLGLVENIDTPMPGVFPENDPRAAITWRQWITMTDGLEYLEFESDILEANDVAQMMYGAGRFDVVGYIRDSFPLKYAPGTRWNYSTASFSLVGRALQNVIGVGTWCSTASSEAASEGASPQTPCSPADAPMAAWIDEVLFRPLGMDAQPEFDLSGTYLGGSHVWATARDYAKLGLLYLRDGVWDGERLLPEGWVDMTRTPPPGGPANFYGAGFWLLPGEGDAFYAQGHEGQTIFIVPSRDLIVVRLALMEENDANWEADLQWNLALARAFP